MPMIPQRISEKTASKLSQSINRLRTYVRWLRLKMPSVNLLAYTQRQWRLLVLVALYVFFRPPIEDKVASLLEFFEPSLGSFVIWLGLIIMLLLYTYDLIRRRYVLSEGMRSWTIVVLIGWGYYRFVGATHYEATPTLIPGISYMDLLLIFCGCVIVVIGLTRWKNSQQQVADKKGMGYQVEQPCGAGDDDLLERRKEAKDLATKIFRTDTSRGAFTLGLTAPWGAGKTSFMLTMKEYLKKKSSREVILLDFNPWMYRKAPNLTQVFFEELGRALAPYNPDLVVGFSHYADRILATESSTWLRLGALLLPRGIKGRSTRVQYELLSREVRYLGRKIFVFIDDVDRLEGEEIVELFSLVRNSSSFPYMSYILAYDKEYVASQLQGRFNQQTLRYMEKILQEEYALAQIAPEHLEHALSMELARLGPVYRSLAEDVLSSAIRLEYHLPTLRAVKRICNTLLSCRKEIEGNVCLFDWFIVELIRTQYPRLFDFLRENYTRAFDRKGDQCMLRVSRERSGGGLREEGALLDHPKYGGVVDFTNYLSEHHEYFQIKNVSLALELLVLLWDRKRRVLPLQANHRDYICRYFYRTLHKGEIDENVFREYVNLPFKEVKSYIQQKHASNQWAEFCDRVRAEGIDNRVKAINMLLIFLYMCSLDGSVLWRAEVESRINALREHVDNDEDMKMTLRSVLECPDVSLGVLRYLSFIMEDEHSITLPFTHDDLEIMREDLFLRSVERMNPLVPTDCFRLWLLCQTYIEEDSMGHRKSLQEPSLCHPRMDEKMKEIIVSNIEQLIPCFIRKSWRDQAQYELLLPYPIWSLDERDKDKGIAYFPDFISQLDGRSSHVIKEFQDFVARRLEHGTSRIRFKFKYITPEDIQRGTL